jgi:hypothetical protein
MSPIEQVAKGIKVVRNAPPIASVLAEFFFPFRTQSLRKDAPNVCFGKRNTFVMPELVLDAFQNYLTKRLP